MLKLMKYELRKTMFSKIVLFTITVIFEIIFLAGVLLQKVDILATGIIFIYLCAIIGIILIGLESLGTLHKDLNTKQSYMLFLTPTNSYQILGAKIITNALTMLLAACFFGVLSVANIFVLMIQEDGIMSVVKDVIQALVSIDLKINGTPVELSVDIVAVLVVLAMLTSWFMVITIGILAIILSASIFAGKKHSGLITFGIFLLITWGVSAITNLLPEPSGLPEPSVLLYYFIDILVSLIFAAILYLISCQIMERRLCV